MRSLAQRTHPRPLFKILHIIDSGGLYGAETVLLTLCQEQKRAGQQPVIASIREKNEQTFSLEEEAHKRGLEAIVFQMTDGPNVVGAWRIVHHARSHGFDILHAHGYKPDILLGFMPNTIRKLPIVSTVHGWTHVGRFDRLALYEYIDALSLRRMDAVCVVNGAMLDHHRLKKVKDKKRLHYVPNGIPMLMDSNRHIEDEITEFSCHGFTIISIGRLSAEKGYGDLIDAFALFCNAYQDAQLVIIGEGPDREILEEKIRHRGLSGRVMLPGYREEAWRYLHCGRVFALSSLTEGLPITILESMRAGIPIVATCVGGIPHVLGHGSNGLLVPPCQPESLFQALKDIREHEDAARERACLAQKLVTMKYSAEAMSRQYTEIYQSIHSTTTMGTRESNSTGQY